MTQRPQTAGDARALLLAAIARHGRFAVASQLLEPGLTTWVDPPTGAVVVFAQVPGARVVGSLPLCARADTAAVMGRFALEARAAKERVSWFCAEERIDGHHATTIGAQPRWTPSAWPDTLKAHRRLREQLRRARAHKVLVRQVAPEELAPGAPLRAQVEASSLAWLGRKHLEPMGFLVTLDLFQAPESHRYFLAEVAGEVVGFLSLVPIPARKGYLFEDLLRAPTSPNGTSELLIDLAMRTIAQEGAEYATLGLAPLSGEVPLALRVARSVGRALYDFHGIRAFKERLHPSGWEQLFLLTPKGASPVRAVLDALRAFAGQPLWRFGVKTLLRHASAIPWALAVPLVPWTLALGLMALLGRAHVLGFSTGALLGWTVFDGLLCAGLFRVALRPRRPWLFALALAASLDAALSLHHLQAVGLGQGAVEWIFRGLATLAPAGGALGLWFATFRRDSTR